MGMFKIFNMTCKKNIFEVPYHSTYRHFGYWNSKKMTKSKIAWF